MPTIYEVAIDYFLRGGVIISIFVFAYQVYKDRTNKKKQSNERISRVCKALKVEVDQLDKWYKSNEYQALKTRHYSTEYIKGNGFIQKNEYFQNIINTAPYDGIVNSGLITYLKEETQSELNKYYAYASLHNKRMFDMAQIYNDKASSPEFNFEDIGKLTSSFAWGLNESELTRYESEMQKLLPELKKLLDEEIEKAEN